jgi:hypothetical protein
VRGSKLEELDADSHIRLRSEAAKIYEQYLDSNLSAQDRILLPDEVLLSFQHYVHPDGDGKSTSEDYYCVVNGQKYVKHQLESLFAEFQHSDSYFQFSSELQREVFAQKRDSQSSSLNITILSPTATVIEAVEQSALVLSLSATLYEHCNLHLIKVQS